MEIKQKTRVYTYNIAPYFDNKLYLIIVKANKSYKFASIWINPKEEKEFNASKYMQSIKCDQISTWNDKVENSTLHTFMNDIISRSSIKEIVLHHAFVDDYFGIFQNSIMNLWAQRDRYKLVKTYLSKDQDAYMFVNILNETTLYKYVFMYFNKDYELEIYGVKNFHSNMSIDYEKICLLGPTHDLKTVKAAGFTKRQYFPKEEWILDGISADKQLQKKVNKMYNKIVKTLSEQLKNIIKIEGIRKMIIEYVFL